MSKIKNIMRGRTFEKEAIKFFEKTSKSSTTECGFYNHPSEKLFGSSPDALGPEGVIVEIKTRAENSEGPIESLKKFPAYFIQCQLQMSCTDAHTCILLSYHPETKTGRFFAIQRNEELTNMIIDICESIYKCEPFICEYGCDNTDIKDICLKLNKYRTVLDCTRLKPLRSYIMNLVKNIPTVNFVDEVDVQKY